MIVVEKLLRGKAPGVDEIRSEFLRALDVVGLLWLKQFCNIIAQPIYICFVYLEKAFDQCALKDTGSVLWEEWVLGPLTGTVFSLYDYCQGLVRIAGSKSDSFLVRVEPGPPLVTNSVHNYYGQNF